MRYSKMYRRIWHERPFRELSDDGRLLYLYLLTSPHANMIGYYYLPLAYAAADLRWPEARVREGLRNLSGTVSEASSDGSERGLVQYDAQSAVVLITDYLRDNPLENPNQVKGALAVLEELPRSCLYQAFCAAVGRYVPQYASRFTELAKRFGDSSRTVSEPSRNQEQDQEQEQVQESSTSIEDDGRANGGAVGDSSPSEQAQGDEVTRQVAQVMAHYNAVFAGLWKHPLRLTRDRADKIRTRLRTYTVEELCQAIDKLRKSPWHCGENPAKKVYGTPEFLFRNDGQVDKFLAEKAPEEPNVMQLSAEEVENARNELERARAAYERRVSAVGN